jgi:NADH:ubiquinone oxidoreductase subunit E
MTASITLLEEILQQYEGRRRDALLPLLWEIQTAYGHIDADTVTAISHTLRVPVSDIYGVISFYSLFHDEPTGQTIIRVCTDPSCGLAGADEVLNHLCNKLNIEPGETTPDGRYTVAPTTCLGLCEYAPAALISQRGSGETSYAPVENADLLLEPIGRTYKAVPGAIRRCSWLEWTVSTGRRWTHMATTGRCAGHCTN